MLTSPRSLAPALAVLSLLWLSASCSSTQDAGDPTPYTPIGPPEEHPIGFFLSELDASLRAWSNLRLGGDSKRDMRTLRILERDLTRRTQERKADLIQELEAGSPNNRAVSAVGLGFTQDPEVQSPLLQALGDPDAEVVNNALLGLGVLGRADTPLGPVCDLLAGSPDPWTRNNAAYALTRIAQAGNSEELLILTARDALADQEPGVRAQAASILGLTGDTESTQALGDLLHDEVSLASAAAASSLSRIGTVDPQSKGTVARLLAQSLDEVPRRNQRWIRRQLVLLCGEDLGEANGPWQDWARRLP